MNLFIPPLGTTITLIEPWKFKLYGEYRNSSMFDYLKLKYPHHDWIQNRYRPQSIDVELPVGTNLKFDRIYIRKGQKGFDSVTFFLITNEKNQTKGRKRFWVKLEDVNKIVCRL